MSQGFQESLLKETPCVVAQSKHDGGLKSSARKSFSRKVASHSFENEFTSLWSTTPFCATSNERCDAATSRKSSSVASTILMRRAPSIVFEDVGGSASQERRAWDATPSSPQTSLRSSVAVDASRVAESTLNSLECWDYSVELECLSGPDGKAF